MRRPIIAGNWKMNNTAKEGAALIEAIKPLVADANCDVVVCVPAIDIRKGVELHPDTASALRNPHQYPKRPTIFRAGSSTKKQGSSILIVRTQYRA